MVYSLVCNLTSLDLVVFIHERDYTCHILWDMLMSKTPLLISLTFRMQQHASIDPEVESFEFGLLVASTAAWSLQHLRLDGVFIRARPFAAFLKTQASSLTDLMITYPHKRTKLRAMLLAMKHHSLSKLKTFNVTIGYWVDGRWEPEIMSVDCLAYIRRETDENLIMSPWYAETEYET